jgi:hypothetical protein
MTVYVCEALVEVVSTQGELVYLIFVSLLSYRSSYLLYLRSSPFTGDLPM